MGLAFFIGNPGPQENTATKIKLKHSETENQKLAQVELQKFFSFKLLREYIS